MEFLGIYISSKNIGSIGPWNLSLSLVSMVKCKSRRGRDINIEANTSGGQGNIRAYNQIEPFQR
jgi:hypothetical protein